MYERVTSGFGFVCKISYCRIIVTSRLEVANHGLVEFHNCCLYTFYEWRAFDCVNTLVISSGVLDLHDLTRGKRECRACWS